MLNSKSDIQAFNLPLYNDHIRSLRVSANFVGADSYNGISQINTQFSQGLNVFGANNNNDFLSRQAGRNNYTKVNLDATRMQFLSDKISILTAVQGQYSFSPLLSAEQFSYGGSQFGLAYDHHKLTVTAVFQQNWSYAITAHLTIVSCKICNILLFMTLAKPGINIHKH